MKRYIVAGIVVIIVAVATIIGLTHKQPVTAPTAKSNGSYVALGDSVAAGVGLIGDSDSSACDRTNQSYPNVVAQSLNLKLSNLACSGATLPAGILGSQEVNKLAETPQLTQLFSVSKPKLVSVTIGANDANWTGIIQKCYMGQCGSDSDTAEVDAHLAAVTTNIQSMLTQMQQHYGTNLPKVVLTGYYQVFPADDTKCIDLTGLTPSELAWGRTQQAKISDTIAAAAKNFPFASFAPVSFAGHELCSANPWVQGLQDKQPYHPTAEGQQVIAQAVIQIEKGSQ